MKFVATELEGVYILECFHAADNRGSFTKTLHKSTFEKHGLTAHFEESFFSVNHKGVVRGMHFQTPPFDHVKLVYCNYGSLNDVVLDMRQSSPTFGKSISVKLSAENHRALYIPSGFAHGFETLEDHTLMTYLTSTEHAPANDAGILYNSFGHQWETASPIISERDLAFPEFEAYKTPFV